LKEKVKSKTALATAIANLGQGSFEKAARAFLEVGSIRALDHWVGQVRSLQSVIIISVY
jgi:hypothetical protein